MTPYLLLSSIAQQSSTFQYEMRMLLPTVIYFAVGLVLFGLSVLLMDKVVPFSLRKEIEEDQNTALAIVIAGVFIGMAIILAAAIKG